MACKTPINVKNNSVHSDFAYNPVPCGKCTDCKRKRVNSWIFRMLQEDKRHKTSVFATLTYEQCPVTENGFRTLQKRDVQLFFKRLRFNTKRKTIRYYVAGEYGTKFMRPHYHAIIFDVSQEEVKEAWEGFMNECDAEGVLYPVPSKNGHVHFGDVSEGSIAYTILYITNDGAIPMHEKDDRLPEFSLMSKRMGSNYLTDQMVRWHKANRAYYVVLPDGHKQSLPRYYRDKVFTVSERVGHWYDVQKEFADTFEKQVENAGGIEEYYRLRFEAEIQLRKNQSNKSKKRKDL